MTDSDYAEPDPAPMIVLFVLMGCFCAYLFWIGTIAIRLWYYKGALGPEPKKFIIVPKHQKERKPVPGQPVSSHTSSLPRDEDIRNRGTVFPFVQEAGRTDPSADNAYQASSHDDMPTINIGDADEGLPAANFDSFDNIDRIQSYIAEERRISRLPAFEQDDCGDGSEFPNVAYAHKPVERSHSVRSSRPSELSRTKAYLKLGLGKLQPRDWLIVDNTYIEQSEARVELLREKHKQCIQTTTVGDEACEELLHELTHTLAIKYPAYFDVVVQSRTKLIRSGLTGTEYSLTKPFDYEPLEICARLAAEDIAIFIKDDFTLQWYLQASASLLPSGYNVSKWMGKSLHAITNDAEEPISMWHDLPKIFNLLISGPNSLFSRTSIYIQTSPPSHSLAKTLHITRPMDFFAGDTRDLYPHGLHVRREIQTFKVLPRSGAVVMTTKTELKRLTELNEKEKADLLKEIDLWDEDEAIFKGRDLWIRVVAGWCTGVDWVKDDSTVIDAGNLTRIGD